MNRGEGEKRGKNTRGQRSDSREKMAVGRLTVGVSPYLEGMGVVLYTKRTGLNLCLTLEDFAILLKCHTHYFAEMSLTFNGLGYVGWDITLILCYL